MPIKDDDDRRAYFREYMRRRRAGEHEPMSAAEAKIGQQNLRSVLLMNSAASIKCAAYEGPVDDKIIEACRRASYAWDELASKLDFEADNSTDAEVAAPEVIERSALHTLERSNEHARMFKKLFKASAFDHEAKERIGAAIDRMILKWRSTQTTLTKM